MEGILSARFLSPRAGILLLVCLLPCLAGCSHFIHARGAERREHGYTLILNGIEGSHVAHVGLVEGLKSGGVQSEIELYDWTTGNPALMLFHLRSERRHEKQAAAIAQKIIAYQDQYPGRPVNLIGHSGGGGMTLLTLEALPPDRRIQSAILLESAISPTYDLRKVFPKVARGIWNYSSSIADSALLVAGTTLAGTIDGKHTVSAGAIGFDLPADATDDDRRLYETKLFERPHDFHMLLNGNPGEHYGCMNPLFVSRELAPIITPSEAASVSRALDALAAPTAE
jgi:pimeloyl-ACP methyl ester carboxylesterase